MAKTVVALYDSLSDAREAIRDLVDYGIARDDISLVAHASHEEIRNQFDESGRYLGDDTVEVDEGNQAGEGAATGAGIGAVVGGVGGLLVGLGLLTVPGVGPALAAGPLASTLVGAGVGGAAGGLLGALIGAGIPEEEADVLAEGVRRGGTLVMLTAQDNVAEEASAILDRHGAIDIDQRVTQWREGGWDRHEPEREPLTTAQVEEERERTVIPIVEEDVEIGKRQVERGGVRVRTFTSEEPVERNVNLHDETVHVHREPANRPASDADFQDRSVEMHEYTEEPVVRKSARVVEEVVLDKDARDHTETVRDTVRHTEVDVEGLDDDFSRYEQTFRGHFRDSDLSNRYQYDDIAPAYRYGWSLANNERFRGREWDEIEPQAREMWEERNQGTWEEFRESVRNSWMEARNRR